VPDELLGQRVKCPTCGTNFNAEVKDFPPAGEPVASEALEADQGPAQRPWERTPGEDDYGPSRRRPSSLGAVAAPGICLLITGILGILINLFQVFYALTPAPPPPPKKAGNPDPNQEFMEMVQQSTHGPVPMVAGAVFAFVSLVVVGGAVAMLRGRMHWLAVTGSVLAIVNIGNFCCVLGAPFGIWSLVVLFREDVRQAFQ
jgi:hypothetical protein